MMVRMVSVLLLLLLLQLLLNQLLLLLQLRRSARRTFRMRRSVSGRSARAAGVGPAAPFATAAAAIRPHVSARDLVADAVVVRTRICETEKQEKKKNYIQCSTSRV